MTVHILFIFATVCLKLHYLNNGFKVAVEMYSFLIVALKKEVIC